MSNFKQFCVKCVTCLNTTSKAYARAHNGQCKACATGEPTKSKDISKHPLLCPDCKEHLLTSYQKAHHYHCDSCTRNADPVGYYKELTTPYEPSDY